MIILVPCREKSDICQKTNTFFVQFFNFSLAVKHTISCNLITWFLELVDKWNLQMASPHYIWCSRTVVPNLWSEAHYQVVHDCVIDLVSGPPYCGLVVHELHVDGKVVLRCKGWKPLSRIHDKMMPTSENTSHDHMGFYKYQESYGWISIRRWLISTSILFQNSVSVKKYSIILCRLVYLCLCTCLFF